MRNELKTKTETELHSDKKSDHDSRYYNIRIIKNYVEYLKQCYPHIDIYPVLDNAGINPYELEDDGYWCTQEQVDSFHDQLVQITDNPSISREAGQYVSTSATTGIVRQFAFGFFTPVAAYQLADKIGSKLTRAGAFKTKKISSNVVETTFTHLSEVEEKPYQCQNRIGGLEALAKGFTGEFAKVEHLECIHKGGKVCKYIVSWKQSLWTKWRTLRNYIILLSILIFVAVMFLLPILISILCGLVCCIIIMGLSLLCLRLENQEYANNIKTQANSAELLLDEINTRYNDALLVHEVGQAFSSILDIDQLLRSVMEILDRRLDFERGMVLLSNKNKTQLLYSAGYGYNSKQKNILINTEIPLDSTEVRGILSDTFINQTPYMADNIDEVWERLPEKSKSLAKSININSFICVPIIFEKESLGVLFLEYIQSEGKLTQSEISLLTGIAQQIAISINNAKSFQKLHESEERYRELVQSANSIIMRIDTKSNITFFNEFAQKFFGYREDEIIGKNVVGTIVPKTENTYSDLSIIIQEIENNPESSNTYEYRFFTRTGEKVWITWSNKAIYDEEGNMVEILSVGSDITDRKKAEGEKKKLEDKLQRAQKMEAIGTLAGGVAHDLNNILSGIVSYPDLLLMDLPEDSTMKKPLTTIKRSGEKAAAIVQDLLALARRGVSVSNVVNLNTIVSEYFKSPEHQRLVDYHHEVEFDVRIDDSLLNIMGSPVHLSKTIMNLVSNAAEAMPNGGKVMVTTENCYIDRPIKGYEDVLQGEYVKLSVADTGMGISQEDKAKIFEPFYTKKVMGRSGTGLGLAVVWATVKDHNSYLDLSSTEGEGTRFDIYFPATRNETEKDLREISQQELMGTEKVLVVDDVPEQREIASKFLTKFGYQVETVSSGEAAIEFFKHNTADLVLLDMIMDPGIDGLETYKKILEIKKDQKALIVSGFSETNRVKETLRLGAGSYVRKPYLLTQIGLAVRKELDR